MKRMMMLLGALLVTIPIRAVEPEVAVSDVSTGLRPVFERYDADRGNLDRFYSIPLSKNDHQRKLDFYKEQLGVLGKINFEGLSRVCSNVDMAIWYSMISRNSTCFRLFLLQDFKLIIILLLLKYLILTNYMKKIWKGNWPRDP